MTNESSPRPDPEDLVAYLDRELDAPASQRIDDLLARDAGVREEVQRLERVWTLLDELPRAEVEETFTQSTVAMVALAAADDAQREQASRPRRLRRRWVAGGVGLAAACLAGFLTVNWLWPNPNTR